MAKDPEQLAHLEWLGYVQPVGLVVSIPALLAAQAQVNRNVAPQHQRFLACLPRDKNEELIPEIRDLAEFTQTVLGWEPDDLLPLPPSGAVPQEFAALEVVLPEYQETLRPTHVVKEFSSTNGQNPLMMLVQCLRSGTGLDEPVAASTRNWHASPHAKFERLLRETEVSIGLLFNGSHLRLVYAPRGETSGHMTFSVAEMSQVAGRPIFAGLHMLTSAERLFSLPENQRLAAILAESRIYQNIVSTQLAEQVLAALYELLRGFQAANDQRRGELLHDVLADDPNHVYRGLLNVLMRLVFILYAEDRGLMPSDPVYGNFYSVTGLFERLRADSGRFPDTMDQRYGAWAQLLTLFHLIYEGGSHGALRIPAREGYLFDPGGYPFLEGRGRATNQSDTNPDVPNVSDGVIFRVLSNLLILDGERLSYRTLDVEQIGSVYEAIMGFNLEVAQGRSIAIKPTKSHGAPTTINLEKLLGTKPAERAKWIADNSDQKLTGQAADILKSAQTMEDLLAALDHKIAKTVTPNIVPMGAMVLQPSDERRRSGSHYTPRSLTQPIVRTTLRPVIQQLGAKPHPEQILSLKVCDPAMGSGAFLVESCRQLGDELVKAWHIHSCVPAIPTDEDEAIFARRLVAQRCLYGVDKNPVAVDLAKMSLWLATLAKDHALTFVDHALRHGDSLVGLSREQIESFHWQLSAPHFQAGFETMRVREHLAKVAVFRQQIRTAAESVSDCVLRDLWDEAQLALRKVRLFGDLVVVAFFEGDKPQERERKRNEYASIVLSGEAERHRSRIEEWRHADRPLVPFHWEIEFPEVFERENSGFDAIVGNPPFLGGSQLSELLGGPEYQEWLKACNKDAFGNGDLCAYFFRRAYSIISNRGTFGFLATKTISEGGTRISGLQAILACGGRIYNVIRSQRWPGQAAVLVVVVHIAARNVELIEEPLLDGEHVAVINSRLHASAEVPDPVPLSTNKEKGYFGTKLGGGGFILSPDQYARLAENSHNRQCLIPYLGGEEVNSSPLQSHERYAINFGSEPLEYAQQFPELLEIVRTQVKPERDRQLDHGPGKHGKKYWWQFVLRADPLYKSIAHLDRCIVTARTTAHLAFSFQPIRQVFSESIVAFAFDSFSAFACLQSSVHNFWAFYFSSYMGETLRYSVSDAFQTFPLCRNLSNDPGLEAAGRDYYTFRAALMIRNNEGLTKTYNRFHEPNERDAEIKKLRELHAAMDRAVLDSYGWKDIPTDCRFLLDYDIDEEEWGDKKKPWRYRWPDEIRDEVLARLLELNRQWAEQERLAGMAGEAGAGGLQGHGYSPKQRISRKSEARGRNLPGI